MSWFRGDSTLTAMPTASETVEEAPAAVELPLPPIPSPPVPDAVSMIAEAIDRAYKAGWTASESRLASPDVADGIAQALRDPASIVARFENGEPVECWTVRAVQQVVAYGVTA